MIDRTVVTSVLIWQIALRAEPVAPPLSASAKLSVQAVTKLSSVSSPTAPSTARTSRSTNSLYHRGRGNEQAEPVVPVTLTEVANKVWKCFAGARRCGWASVASCAVRMGQGSRTAFLLLRAVYKWGAFSAALSCSQLRNVMIWWCLCYYQ